MVKTSGKLAVLEERINNHTEEIKELKTDIKEIKDTTNDIKSILVSGEGKIKRNYMLIKSAKDEMKTKTRNMIAIVAIISSVISSFICVGVTLALN